jgi:23S rRNA pseudouridine955/2504/2580 synthase
MIHTVTYTTPIRLDRFIKQLYPMITQGVIQQAMRRGLIKVNEKKIKEANLRLQQNDVLNIADHFEQYTTDPKDNTYVFNDSIKALSAKILDHYLIFSNDDFIVINKPAKIASQGGTNLNISIDDALKYLNCKGGNFKLVHRLDKETSGVMLIAKHYDAAVKLTGAFRDKKIYKTYLALSYGIPSEPSGVIELEDEITHYKLLKYFPEDDISYIEFKPITGKEHQVRRHALEIGVSIVGDKKYGDISSKEPYMMLHSYKTQIATDVFNEEYEFTAPLPKYFRES